MNYAYTNIKNLTIKENFLKSYLKKENLKNLSTCIKNRLKWTNPNYKLIKVFKNIYR